MLNIKLKDMTLNEKLSNMYQHPFDELVQHLKSDGLIDMVQPPFLLGLQRDKDGHVAEGAEEWYTEADLKVMVFGREVHEWGWPKNDDGTPIISDDLVEAYELFYSQNYNDHCFMIDTDAHLSKSPFFRTGFNGLIEDGINERLKKQYPGKRAAYLWNEISKLSTTEGISRKVSSHIHEYERKYFHVIPKEIELLKPDVVIFLTGFKDPYDSYIHENFNVEASLSVGNISTNDVIKLKLQGIPLAYKTHHPGANKVTGHIHFLDKEKGIHYNAISDDIAANFKTIWPQT
jgi:hypothetical protein